MALEATTTPHPEHVLRNVPLSPCALDGLAVELATSHRTTDESADIAVADMLARNHQALREAYGVINDAARANRSITPAAQWLLDNFHLVLEQAADLPDQLSPALLRKLPRVLTPDNGVLITEIRIFAVLRTFVSHVDSRFELDVLQAFLMAYQSVTPLAMAELWAIPGAFRFILVDNLRRVAEMTARSMGARSRADEYADRLLAHMEAQRSNAITGSPPPPRLVLPDEPLQLPFPVQLIERLRHRGDDARSVLEELAGALELQGLTLDEAVRREHNRQSANNATACNIITGLREIGAVEWRSAFEFLSFVEHILGNLPSYVAVDHRTRDRYRNEIAQLAEQGDASEVAIATALRGVTERADPGLPLGIDLGYHLVDAGRPGFERLLGATPGLADRIRRGLASHGTAFYVTSIALATTALAAVCLEAGLAGMPGLPPPTPLIWLTFGLLALFPASDVAIRVLNWVLIRGFPARSLSRLALATGLPRTARTLVVVPIMLTSVRDLDTAVEQLEVHALANADPQLQLALLSDWPDSDREICPGDLQLVSRGRTLIAELNSRYSRGVPAEPRFHLFHRHRVWSAGEGCWMGWERKRGKLAELNRLLVGHANTSFMPDPEGLPVPTDIRYVLTLDADTRLPMGSVRKLVGTALHPLNQPRWDPSGHCLVRGFGILQPRITPLLADDAERSAFQWVTAGSSGMDPYAGAVSDVYQDFLGTGIYTGKGLYDLPAFEQALRDRVPENAVLSHDLLEGLFARCGLVTDVEVYEEFPSHSEVAAARTHRWMRGDWQLLPWLVGRRRGETSLLGKWQIFDNLRRSLLAPAAVTLLVATWCTPAAHQALWVALVLAPLLVPTVLDTLAQLINRTTGVALPARVHGAFLDLLSDLGRTFVSVALLAQNAWLTIDAVARSLFRLLSKRRLLEWITAAQVKAVTTHGLPMFVWPLKSSAIVVISGTAAVVWANPERLWAAAPWLFLWWLTPVVARSLSLPWFLRTDSRKVPAGDVTELRNVARRTWRFFTTFVTAVEQHLPPDNFQEHPAPVIAHRTSPTNIGLYLLAVGTARDFGWLGLSDAGARWIATLSTLDKLELFRGHLYNWYDSRTLAPLAPRYVSTVDSGNLAGHLIALKQYCLESLERPVLETGQLGGLRDTANAVVEALAGVRDVPRLAAVATSIRDELKLLPDEPIAAFARLVKWQELASELATLAADVATDHGEPDADYLHWANALAEDVASHLRDWQALMPRGLAALPPEWRARMSSLANSLTLFGTLKNYPELCRIAAATIDQWVDEPGLPGNAPALRTLAEQFRSASRSAATLAHTLGSVSQRADTLADGMRFDFLFDSRRGLFSIGYRVEDSKLDPSYYDLLASEARLASFVAIAKRDVPVRHWFRLGRPLAGPANQPVLLSWSGSMFEYLMPSLVMRNPRGSLLAGTCRRALRKHVAYGKARRVPWGISEAAFNLRDQQLTYQYSAFGVPGLGLKRGLARDLVVAPYASALAIMVDAPAVVQNFAALRARQASGRFGFYESIDFTADRLPPAATHAVVLAYMAHHQAMSLVAIGNALHDGGMQRRFHRETMIQAADLLLHERTPRHPRTADPLPDSSEPVQAVAAAGGTYRHFEGVRSGPPVAHLLSNGRYAVMLTVNGAGYSECQDRAVTRWRDDPTCERYGTFFYLRDVDSGEFWSAGLEPCEKIPTSYEVCFDEDSARISRIDGTLKTVLEAIVSPEDDAELRRLTIRNLGVDARHVDVTSYTEIVLAPQAADVAHPAFSNLFVLTEYDPASRALLATRRPRTSTEPVLWAAHVLAVGGGIVDGTGDHIEYETDRGRFIGRNADVRAPGAIVDGRPLSNTAGAVLDPVFSLRARVEIPAGGEVQLTFSTLLAQSRVEALRRAELLTNPMAFERVAMLAWTYARAGLHHLAISEAEARLFQSLVTHLLFANAEFRADQQTLMRSRLSVSGLWRFGISGDRPCVLLRCSEPDHIQLAQQLVRAQAFWHTKQLAVDIVLLNERPHSYIQELQQALEELQHESRDLVVHVDVTRRGQVFVIRADQVADSELTLLLTAANVILYARQGSLAEQLSRRARDARVWRRPAPTASSNLRQTEFSPVPELEFSNDIGGFADNGREYVVCLNDQQHTPAPWSNVIANAQIGCLITESGAGCTWVGNSRENQLTPWSNDPVADWSGEACYIRDDRSGVLWSPTAHPIRLPGARYVARHGQGYSEFDLYAQGIASRQRVFVVPDDPVKVVQLRLTNRSGVQRRLSVAFYHEWVLGATRQQSARFITTEVDAPTGALFARNPWNTDFGTCIAFADLLGKQQSISGNRREFVGCGGSLRAPVALVSRTDLSNQVGAGLDACGALLTTVDLSPLGSITVTLILGQAADVESCRTLIGRYRGADMDDVHRQVQARWQEVLGAVQIQTPDRSMDLLANRWLLYQVLSGRFRGRAGFYQAGGAFGFRDQLQDCLALLHAAPQLAREHLLLAARHQFGEGDVQHWWHPPSGKGVRTNFVDDRVWLPFVVSRYITATGDHQILDQTVPFVDGPGLEPGAEAAYFQPGTSENVASLYEHCARALDRSLATGTHGLPLFGGGDWNDGMNRVGHLGKGESTWMAWFLCTVLPPFAEFARAHGDLLRAESWLTHSAVIRSAAEAHAWDGAWYRRGYFDDGSPLGSAANLECRIDSVAQSWSVLSGAADPVRARAAMDSVSEYLIRPADDLLLLLTPPFDRTSPDPGYIQGYVPGLRENGGQYTHAAVWCLMAEAQLGRRNVVGKMFDMVNPIRRSATRRLATVYRVEPYVVAADINSEPPNAGRGGWTWYTGAAGWLYQAILESMLGVSFRATTLTIHPTIPPAWSGFQVEYRARGYDYTVTIENRGNGTTLESVEVDGVATDQPISLVRDGKPHAVRVVLS